MDNLSEAREIFFDHDGSEYYMLTNDILDKYRSFRVPLNKERQWLKELTDYKLLQLTQSGNGHVIQFLEHHGMFQYSELILKNVPLGTLVEKAIFLENLFNYGGHLANRKDREIVYSYIIEQANCLAKDSKSHESLNRFENLLKKCTKELEPTTIQRIIKKYL